LKIHILDNEIKVPLLLLFYLSKNDYPLLQFNIGKSNVDNEFDIY